VVLSANYPQPMIIGDSSISVSVVIVSWNAREFLLQCIDSVSEQLGDVSAEIIVVDNASSDGSAEAVRHRFPHVRIIQNAQNVGFAAANNIGIQKSTGKYLFLINSDIVLRRACISRLCSYMERQPKVGMAGPTILNGDLTLQDSVRPFPTLGATLVRALGLDRIRSDSPKRQSGLRTRISGDYEADILSGCFWVIRRVALADVGLLDPGFFMYAEDKDLCVRFWRAGWIAAYVPAAQAIHYGGASSSNQPVRFYVEMHRANIRYWRKHHGRVGENVVRAIMLVHQVVRLLAGALTFAISARRRKDARLVMQRSGTCARFLLFGH
jgi:GT2 family glycosyltransferase